MQTLICSRSCQMVKAPLLMSFCPTLSPAKSATLIGRPFRAKNCRVSRHERTSHSVCSHRRVRACKQPQCLQPYLAGANEVLSQDPLQLELTVYAQNSMCVRILCIPFATTFRNTSSQTVNKSQHGCLHGVQQKAYRAIDDQVFGFANGA